MMNSYYLSEEDVPFDSICLKKPSKYGIKIWMMCDCARKYMMDAKLYLGKENNEVDRELGSNIVCTLVEPISGQQSGQNVTTDHIY